VHSNQGWQVKVDVGVAQTEECTVVGSESLKMSLTATLVLGQDYPQK